MSDDRGNLNFRNDRVEKALFDWWEKLHDKDHRGERARLRRCREPEAVIFEPFFHRLKRDLQNKDVAVDRRLVFVAGVLAHVKNRGPALPAAMAQSREGGSTPRVSGLRFRRLLQNESRGKLYPALIRILGLVDGATDPVQLAEDIYYWGSDVRQTWAYTYYDQAPQAD